MSEPEAPSYPPDVHVVRDLAPVVERDGETSAILLPIVPEILDDAGRARVGAIATAVDIIGGETAIREVLPQWIATSSLSLQVDDTPSSGTLRARPRVVRKGRTTLIMEVDVDHLEREAPVGLATIAFAILPGRNPLQARVDWAEEPRARSTFALPDSGFEKPLLDALGVVFDPADPAVTRLDVTPYVLNTLGAMQGGVVGMLIDAAADHYAASVAAELPGARGVRVRGLEIHYLKLARGGPVRADVRELGRVGAGLVLRVELRDEGREDVLTTLATVLVDGVA